MLRNVNIKVLCRCGEPGIFVTGGRETLIVRGHTKDSKSEGSGQLTTGIQLSGIEYHTHQLLNT